MSCRLYLSPCRGKSLRFLAESFSSPVLTAFSSSDSRLRDNWELWQSGCILSLESQLQETDTNVEKYHSVSSSNKSLIGWGNAGNHYAERGLVPLNSESSSLKVTFFNNSLDKSKVRTGVNSHQSMTLMTLVLVTIHTPAQWFHPGTSSPDQSQIISCQIFSRVRVV